GDRLGATSGESSPEVGRGPEPRRLVAQRPGAVDRVPSGGASPMVGRRSSASRGSASRGLSERWQLRQSSFSSMVSATRSAFGGSHESREPTTSESGATGAMDMIAHDTVRSWDLKAFWRTASPSIDGMRMGSLIDLPWPVRRWCAGLGGGPSPCRWRVKQLVSSTRYEEVTICASCCSS
ncbi:unnamed protein product, partial [Prorocentrum cordatum]